MQPRTLWVKRDTGEATPAGWFLAYSIVAIAITILWWSFLILSTFVVEPAVYNFIQTKEGYGTKTK